MTVLKPVSTEDGIKVSEDSDRNEQRVTTTLQGIVRILACYEEDLKEKEKVFASAASVFDFFKSSSRSFVITVASQNDKCPHGSKYPMNAVAMVRNRITTPTDQV